MPLNVKSNIGLNHKVTCWTFLFPSPLKTGDIFVFKILIFKSSECLPLKSTLSIILGVKMMFMYSFIANK